jgi:hypothetical protein
MSPWLRLPAQAALYAAFAAVVGALSTAPAWELRGPDEAVLKLSVAHAGRTLVPCRERSPEELARLAPNMRAALECPRERSPLEIELVLDGRVLYHDVVPPTGLARDGMSSVYRRFRVPAGRHRLAARLKDHRSLAQYNFVREATVTLAPGEVYVVDFNRERGGFEFR